MIEFPERLRIMVGVALLEGAVVQLAPLFVVPLVVLWVAEGAAGQTDTIPVPDAIRAAYAQGTRDPSGFPGPRYWQIRPEYHLRGTLLPEEGEFAGEGHIQVENASPTDWTELVLRLDQNRFRGGRTGGVSTRGMTIRELRVDGVEISLGGERITGRNSTVMRIALEEVVRSGDGIRIEFSWDYEVPLDESGSSLRQGRWGTTVFQMGQWYPRLAMYDDLGGWDVAEHDGSMEFFNPFASFRVSLDLPTGWLVGATGWLENGDEVLSVKTRRRLLNAGNSDTTVIVVGPDEVGSGTAGGSRNLVEWRFAADSVNDFAWGASPEYSWVSTSRELPSGERMTVHGLATQRHYEALADATGEAADALSDFSTILGQYPWSNHWLIDGPEGGMEYPGVTMSHGDGRTLHEMVHQWFPMTIGSDETRFNFMDEGLASFLPSALRPGPLGVLSDEREALVPILLPDDLRTVRMVLGYGRGSRMLAALAEDFGDQPILEGLQRYSIAWRFKHPSPWDLMAALEESIGTELDAFWVRWLFKKDAIQR